MRTVFFGTPRWAVPSLRALVDANIEVVGVVTNPDKPAGRGMRVHQSSVAEVAAGSGLPLLQPRSARDPQFADELRALAPDVAAVVAYGKILPVELLAIPPLGFVNVHFSLLPAYRGAAPVQRALMDGATRTGVSIMVLTEGMDEGPVLAQRSVDVGETETAGELGERLAVIGAHLLVETLPPYAAGATIPQPQDDAAATYAPKVTSDDARIEWRDPARRVTNLVRGLDPEPGAWTTFKDKRVKLFRCRPVEAERELEPGELSVAAELLAGTGSGAVAVGEAQAAGKRKMGGVEFARGLRLAPGDRFE